MENTTKRITDYFGENVFNDEVMQEYMSLDTYKELREVIDSGKSLGLDLANRVAEAMKEWAMNNGATHYTHWFQPLTGATAEKHDSFISIDKHGKTILEFTGKNLSKGEADASSFPSGGIRAVFEARGYTVWDCSSPAFIKKIANDRAILYIPTAFCSYNGEALDKKTPLLRSMEALNREGVRLMHLLGYNDVNKVVANVGGEQEYFLIDKKHYDLRPDLKFTGRTLFGSNAPKGQEQNDQYYASIKTRVANFMAELNDELWKLGITAKTQHNEAAPCQHELAPIFCTANIATDQNQIIMDTMKKVAEKFGLVCLLHEKPFANVNGSGKHNNWSVLTDTGVNLLKPGKNPSNNTLFLLTIMAVIAGVDEYADLIRTSASNPGNEYRLGGHEAPPSIISVYIGDDLQNVIDNFVAGNSSDIAQKQFINTGVNYLAELSKDTSDRNRTSPFAFTGNKFEFRMVGSSATLANPNTTINTIVAEMFARIADELEGVTENERTDKVIDIIKRLYNEHRRVIFNGNNYAKEWLREAKKRGLNNITNCVDAYDSLTNEKSVELFGKHKVMSEVELQSRREIYLDVYNK
ncbi:MAG: glutamine synthetase III, partial [Clostridia bacterium]|nr:glutamine synthetase III [Clostridia bacterium]